VFAQAVSVLGSDDKARRWIVKPSRALGGESPLHLLDTDIGTNAVLDELGRIEHGVFS
jgi:putative toxin-antitoxin system antitoxin component (TIGR02293 family)